ncbi:MAG: B12-binding domain-containing protein [Kofleriaceae bacterium]
MTALLTKLAQEFVQAQLAGDRRAALMLVANGVSNGLSVADIQQHVIRAAQEEIGRLWQMNSISIAQEHLATGISQIALARLFDYAPAVPNNGKLVYLACVQGEQHDLPARLVADYLDHGGFTVRYFGPDVPTHDLVGSIRNKTPDLLALSVTMSFNVGALRSAVRQVRLVAPELPIAVGGHAVRWSEGVLVELGVKTAPSDPASLIAFAREMVGL